MPTRQPTTYALTSWIRAQPALFAALRRAYLAGRPVVQRLLYSIRGVLPPRLQIFAVRGRAQAFMALVAPDRSFLYVTVQKAGTSTLRRRLWKLYGVDVPEPGATSAVSAHTGPYLGLHDVLDHDLGALLRGAGTYRFTFVRNPYSRLISAYRDKILNLNGNEEYKHDLPLPSDRTPTFAEFVRAATDTADEGCDWHWISQHRATMCDIVKYDYVGRLESLDEDFGRVLHDLGRTDASASTVANLNRYSPLEDDGGGCVCRYDEALADLVWRRYRRDFQVFGYERESWRSLS
jgi:dermatan 4-sulfotransferase 1